MARPKSYLREVLDGALVLSGGKGYMSDSEGAKHLSILLFTTPYNSESTSTAIKLARPVMREGHKVTIFA